MNIKDRQVDYSKKYLESRNRTSYDFDFEQWMTSLYFDAFRKKDATKPVVSLEHTQSNGDELIELEKEGEPESWKWIFGEYSKITEGVIEAHTAEVLARQNRERKMRADKFTEEESGLNRLYREFQLGRQFVSIDEMGIETEMAQMDA
jgi:hypothetical protein